MYPSGCGLQMISEKNMTNIETTREGDDPEPTSQATPSPNRKPEFSDPVEAIKYHMAQQGLTQRDLIPMIGSRSKVSEVLSGTRSLTMSMARALHRHLGVPADVLLKEPVLQAPEAEMDWWRFPLRQMARRQWIETVDRPQEHAKDLITDLMRRADQTQVPAALFRRNDRNRANAKTNPYALTAWCWQVLAQANENNAAAEYLDLEDSLGLMTEVARLSPAPDGPLRAVEFLNQHGIAVEIVRHLPRTHLDGAAMRSADGRPVIGLTLRYDRVDNFWWVLLHELAHVTRHQRDSDQTFVDDLNIVSEDDKELDADYWAREASIPEATWESSEVSQNPSPMAVMALAQERGIHPAIVAGRARYERGNYRLLTQFVGSRTVRSVFDV